MPQISFTEYLTRLHASGEFGLFMSESKRFFEAYLPKNSNDTKAQDLADQLSPLMARWSTLEREEDEGIVSRQDLVLERNKINQALYKWLGSFKESAAATFAYKSFGNNLSADLFEKIRGDVPDNTAGDPPQGGSSSRKTWLIATVLAIAGVVLYLVFFNNSSGNDGNAACQIKVRFMTHLYPQPDLTSKPIMTFNKSQTLEQLGFEIVKKFSIQTVFFKVKVDGVEGWINYDETEKSPACFTLIQPELNKANDDQSAAEHQNATDTQVPAPGSAQEDEPNASAGHQAESGCYLTGGMLTTVFSKPNMFSEQISRLKEGERYKILDRHVYNHGGLSRITFYKVNAGNGNIGWVQQDADLNISGACR